MIIMNKFTTKNLHNIRR